MANYVVSDTSLGSVADAIRTKGGTSAPLTYPQGFIDAIDDIQTGGGAPTIQSLTVTENGTYTAPSGVDGYSPVTVNVSSGGDAPIPDDGKTRIFIHIAEGTPDNRLTFYLRFTASEADNTTVDWGDGTTQTLGTTYADNYPHKYPSGGDYIIAITVNTGTISFEGDSSNSIYGSKGNENYHNRFRIQKVIIGDNVTIGDYAFNACHTLALITIPDSVTNIGASAFNSCYILALITIPDSVTSIKANAFQACYGFTSITIPDSVTNIGAYAFRYCHGISKYHLKPTTPPTLANTNVFNDIPSDCIIYVPQGSLSAYQQATNWSQYSSKMQEEPV